MRFHGWLGEVTQSFEILWKIYANLFNDVLHVFFIISCCSIFKKLQSRTMNVQRRMRTRGLRRWMLNSALMVINELLMEKSLITHIIFRLIFFRSCNERGKLFWITEQEGISVSVCLWMLEFSNLQSDNLLQVVIRKISAKCLLALSIIFE